MILAAAVCFATTSNESATYTTAAAKFSNQFFSDNIIANIITIINQIYQSNSDFTTLPIITSNISLSTIPERSRATTTGHVSPYSALTSTNTLNATSVTSSLAQSTIAQSIPPTIPSAAASNNLGITLSQTPRNESQAFPSTTITFPLSSLTTIYSTSNMSSVINPYSTGAIKKSFSSTATLPLTTTGSILTSTKIYNSGATTSGNRR